MDGKGARQGQPEAAKHRCFNRYLNGVNLAPSNGEALSEDITTVGYIRFGERGLFEDDRKILKLFGNFYYSPEEGLCICSFLLEAYFQPTRLLIGFSKSLLGRSWTLESSFLSPEYRRKTCKC